MSSTEPVRTDDDLLAELVDADRLSAWLTHELGSLPGPLRLERISTGHTNEIILVETGDNRWILRRPPRTTTVPPSMAREYRVLKALDQTDVPHPRTVALCSDPDVIGAPFFIMEFVDGIGAGLPLPEPFTLDIGAQRDMAFSMIDSLAKIALVDWQAIGLDGFGKPEGFLGRQVRRWTSQLDTYRTREIAGIDEVAMWLEKHRPISADVGIIHGDYQWNNVMFGRDLPGRVVAVVDWEQSTIGDPLLDIGWLLGLWYHHDEDALGRDADRLFCKLPHMPTRQELVDRYISATGREVDDLRYYCTLALFKLACVIEGSYSRFVAGESDDPLHATFEVRVPALIARAASFMHGEIS